MTGFEVDDEQRRPEPVPETADVEGAEFIDRIMESEVTTTNHERIALVFTRLPIIFFISSRGYLLESGVLATGLDSIDRYEGAAIRSRRHPDHVSR